jgi:transcriptional regulator with XRE-family HTH domain
VFAPHQPRDGWLRKAYPIGDLALRPAAGHQLPKLPLHHHHVGESIRVDIDASIPTRYYAVTHTSDVKIGENLRKEMDRQGVTEYALGKRSGVPQPTIHRILTGESRNPKARTLDRLARTLGMSHDDLVRGEPRRPGLPVRDETPAYDPETLRVAQAIQSLPPKSRVALQTVLDAFAKSAPWDEVTERRGGKEGKG